MAKKDKETKDLAVVPATIANFNIESLMAKAIEQGLSPETMEKFLAMRQQLKAEWATEQYNRAMASFQSECPTIQKTKEVKNDSGKVLYKYAPIESIVEQVKPYLQKYGFSYSTSMEVLADGVKVVCKVIHQDGHSEESPMQVPLGTKTGIMSSSQQTAAAQTFAKRYAFCNAFGILTGDEDNDGANIAPATKEDVKVEAVMKGINALRDAKTAKIWLEKLENSDLSSSQKATFRAMIESKIKTFKE